MAVFRSRSLPDSAGEMEGTRRISRRIFAGLATGTVRATGDTKIHYFRNTGARVAVG